MPTRSFRRLTCTSLSMQALTQTRNGCTKGTGCGLCFHQHMTSRLWYHNSTSAASDLPDTFMPRQSLTHHHSTDPSFSEGNLPSEACQLKSRWCPPGCRYISELTTHNHQPVPVSKTKAKQSLLALSRQASMRSERLSQSG